MFKPAPHPQRAMLARSANAYRSVEVESRVRGADAHQLVALLYDEIAASLQNALQAQARAEAQARIHHIERAVRLIDQGLKAGLDLRAGGALAANLLAVYDQMGLRLAQAKARGDAAPLEEAIRLLEPVRSAWRAIGQPRSHTAVQ